MKLDTVMLGNTLADHLRRFLNELWGSPEAAAEELLHTPSLPTQSQNEMSKGEAAGVLRAFIENYDAIASRAGWRGQSLLAYAIAIESCIDNLCNEEDEHIALLCLRRLLDATGAGTGTAELSVLSLRLEIDSRLEEK